MGASAQANDRPTVLLVEDDPILIEITAAQFNDSGFAVHRAHSAEEALTVLRSGQAIDAVFSDVVLPGEMSGLQLARTVAAEFPAIAVLLTSGFSAAFDVAQVRGLETIAKPYDYAVVADRLTRLIGRHRSA